MLKMSFFNKISTQKFSNNFKQFSKTFKKYSTCNGKIYDSVVLGLGGVGSASLYHLSKTGQKVLGIEKYSFPHINGSSHGDSRIIREAYFEGEFYVPFVQRAYKLWDELEKKTGTQLFLRTGAIGIDYCTPPLEEIVEKAIHACKIHKINYQSLTNEEINKKYPFFNVPKNCKICSEINGGMLFPEKCVDAHISESKKNKADFLFNTQINYIKFDEREKIYVLKSETSPELNIKTNSIILSCGSWMNHLLKNFNLHLPLLIDLNHVFYFKFKDPKKNYDLFPIYLVSYEGNCYYGFPNINNGNGFKISIYKQNISFKDVDDIERIKMKDHIFNKIMKFGENFISGFNKDSIEIIKCLNCLYTSTPDYDFILDYIPNTNQKVVIASACSGHGFKFASRTGEHAANLILKKENPIENFKLQRFLN